MEFLTKVFSPLLLSSTSAKNKQSDNDCSSLFYMQICDVELNILK